MHTFLSSDTISNSDYFIFISNLSGKGDSAVWDEEGSYEIRMVYFTGSGVSSTSGVSKVSSFIISSIFHAKSPLFLI